MPGPALPPLRSATRLLQPLVSPLPSESQNLPSWEKEGRAGLVETTLAQLSAPLPRTSAGREILLFLLLAWLQQLLPSPQKGTAQSSPHLASVGETEVPAGQCLPPEEDSWGVERQLPPGQRGPSGAGVQESVFLCPKAPPHPVPGRFTRAHRNLRLECRKTLPPRSLQSPLTKSCPSAVPFSATCWSTLAPTSSPPIPLGPAWHW